MKRIVTNIVELDKLYKEPCESWKSLFRGGKVDAHDAFKKYGERYDWLYCHSPYDLIRWEILNNCFNWEEYSYYVVKYCPDMLDPLKYNWERDSRYVAEYCPEKLDPERYNWEEYSSDVAKYCPDKLKLKPVK
jgi:hypothetical protein